MSNRTILTLTHIGQDVPFDKAAPMMLARIGQRLRITETGCWEYQGSRNQGGYGQEIIGGKRWMIHRLMYKIANGKLARDLDVLHRCDNPSCCNPVHLRQGDPKENSRECVEKGRHHMATRETCAHGHPYAIFGKPRTDNPNWRICTQCERERYQREKNRATPPRKKGFCKRGHEIVGDNVYKKPNGRVQCKLCHDAAVKRLRAERAEKRAGFTSGAPHE